MRTTQASVAEFVTKHKLEVSVEVRLLDLVSEVGELAKESLKGTQYGKVPFAPPSGWSGELADVLFSLVCVANSSGIDLEQALQGALAKYGERLARKGEPGSGR